MSLEQGIEEFLSTTEIRGPKPSDGLIQVDDAAARPKVEHAKSTDHFEALSARYGRTPAIVDEQQVG
jgi:hypothetical protein